MFFRPHDFPSRYQKAQCVAETVLVYLHI
jgi:hypothetical protein